MSDAQEPEDITRYSLTFSLDRGNFFRRACPSCGRHFKTKVNPGDLAVALQPAFRQLDLEIGAVRTEEGRSGDEQSGMHLYCPYCAHCAESSNTLTQEFSEYLNRYAMREVLLPKVHKAFSAVSDSFGRHSTRSQGLFSIEWKFELSHEVLPPRPISGPEPPDMTTVELLCCGKQAKILDGWHDLITCPFCGIEAILQ